MIARTWFLLVAAFLAVVLPSAEAWAQTASVTLGTNYERRSDRPEGLGKTTINYDDCVADDTLGITYTISGAPQTLEVWVGTNTNCGDINTRMLSGNVPGNCWQVGAVNAPQTSTIGLKVRDLLPHGASNAGTGTAQVCADLANGTGTTAGNGTLNVYFVLLMGTSALGAAPPLAVPFDLQGPPPPTKLSVLLGDTRLFPSWNVDSSASTDSLGYYIYCEQASSTSPCSGTALVAGMVPPANIEENGETGKSTTSGEASGLTNGVAYACGVAGFDALFNVGKLSELVCATPEPVNGYFKQYRAAGGQAGGGYCTFARSTATPAAVLTPLAALALLVLRRRKRQSASA